MSDDESTPPISPAEDNSSGTPAVAAEDETNTVRLHRTGSVMAAESNASMDSSLALGTSPRSAITKKMKTAAGNAAAAAARDRNNANLENIFENNKVWVESMPSQYFLEVGRVHKPKYMWIGCSDARVPANEIMGLGPGEVFVHRNVANLVISSDVNLLTCLTYAVAVLKVEHIIVCGHYDCGGIRASALRRDQGVLDSWLIHIRDIARLHADELKAIPDIELCHRKLVEVNVIEQCINLFKTGVVQKALKESAGKGAFSTPRIHGMVFNPSDGYLRRLPVNFKDLAASLDSIYGLY